MRLHSLLFFTFYVFPFCLEINTHTDHILISWEAMNRDWLQQKPPARWTHSSLSEETWMSCVCIQFTTFCWADIFEVTWVGYESDLCHWSDTRQGCVCNITMYVIRGNNVNSEKIGQILFTLFRYFLVKIWRRRCFPGRGLNSGKDWTQ